MPYYPDHSGGRKPLREPLTLRYEFAIYEVQTAADMQAPTKPHDAQKVLGNPDLESAALLESTTPLHNGHPCKH